MLGEVEVSLTDVELERIEKKYLDQLYHHLKSREEALMDGLHTKDKIRDDWIKQYQAGGKATDLDRGAERIFYWLIAAIPEWTPNSAPVGSNLLFETRDAFLHIEIKTSRIDNHGDYRGLVPISIRQTSYPITRIDKPPELPTYYNEGKESEKPSLTYAIQIVHNPETLEIIAILLISIPNGQLYGLYGDDIIGAGKIKGHSLRYRYKAKPQFEALPDKDYRVIVFYFNESSGHRETDITTIDLTKGKQLRLNRGTFF